ncbi:MAG: hypothetical protein U0930_06895 [Pirellulales bacterium]
MEPNNMEFSQIYARWKKIEPELRIYSKTTPIKKMQEYKDFLTLGKEIIPLLEEKLRQDDGMDFVLCDVVIELSDWQEAEFPSGDMGARVRKVLEKLEEQRGESRK